MPKGKRLSAEDIKIIDTIYNQNKASNAKTIRKLVSERLKRKIGLSTIQRELAILKKDKTRGSTDPIDNQWSLASLKDYPVAAPALYLLLYLQGTYEKNIPKIIKKLAKEQGIRKPFLTNRVAVWFSRLLILAELDPVISKKMEAPISYNKWPDWIEDLVLIAFWYSNYEMGYELQGMKLVNTILFDAPTLPQIKSNILRYNMDILKNKGIVNKDNSFNIEKLKVMDITDILPKGGLRNARTYNKKR